MSAAMTPGIQPQSVRIRVMIKEPHPLSTTASGGKIMQSMTRQTDII